MPAIVGCSCSACIVYAAVTCLGSRTYGCGVARDGTLSDGIGGKIRIGDNGLTNQVEIIVELTKLHSYNLFALYEKSYSLSGLYFNLKIIRQIIKFTSL